MSLLCHTSLGAQNLMLPEVDFVAYEQEAMEAVKRLPKKGGFKKNHTYYHLYIFATQLRDSVDWDSVKTQMDFIRAIDFQSPVLFEDMEVPTNIYADYIYDSKGKMQWIYANGEATKVIFEENESNLSQSFLEEVAKQQYQMVFVVKELSPDNRFFGIRDGKVYTTQHIIWEAYDTNSISDLIADNRLISLVNKKSIYASSADFDNLTEDMVIPSFMGGGLDLFRQWFMEELESHPEYHNIEPSDTCLKFSVNEEGWVDYVEIVVADNLATAQIMADIVRTSPQWTIGTIGGEPSKFYFQLPISFKTLSAYPYSMLNED